MERDELMQFEVGGLKTKTELIMWSGEQQVLITQDSTDRDDDDDTVMIPIDVFRTILSKLRIH